MKPIHVRITMSLALLVAMALIGESAFAQPAEKGGVTGNVIALDGKPAAGFNVKLVKDVPLQMGRPGSGRGAGSGGGTKTIAQTKTDANGRFTFNGVEVGDYRIEGGNRNVGWLYEDVNIEANKTAEKKDIKLFKTD